MRSRTRSNHNGNPAGDLAKGASAGVAATWVMGLVTSYPYENESKQPREVEYEARGGKTAYGEHCEQGTHAHAAELLCRGSGLACRGGGVRARLHTPAELRPGYGEP